jgi:prepilin-type N-terminal cleavage/methylation domain-containing protein
MLSAFQLYRSGMNRMVNQSRGMTLVEILIAMAIASLMTLTGWRAVDALQTSRDRVTNEAAQWQRLDDFFVTLESDLRRASITEFSGSAETMILLQPALDGGPDVQKVRYQLATSTVGTNSAFPNIDVIREAASARLPLAEVRSMTLAYSADGVTFESATRTYPRAIRITAVAAGSSAPVERLFALQ